eukprot:comp8350_c0_seq1/m.9050 comp8350_c0_seq1/g.9050  ORF comp8350_c0_seq1/g.9050 comp8350_c0_seq1/m.9050 type:complete len:146 (-) comp8350_c0_seq1:37-474(-)
MASTSSTAANEARESEEVILQRFEQMRAKSAEYMQKIAELEGEKAEHNLVLATMEKMDGSRKCFRMIGGVLVERTVAEVGPAVKANRDGIETIIVSLKKNHSELSAAIQQYIKTYDIKTRDQVEAERLRQQSSGGQGEKSTGVLA